MTSAASSRGDWSRRLGAAAGLAAGVVAAVVAWRYTKRASRAAYVFKQLPADAYCYKENKVWDQSTFPKGFLVSHNTKPGVWAQLSVLTGSLRFHVIDGKGGPILATAQLEAGSVAVVEPQQYHRVELDGPVEAILRFCRLPAADGSRPMVTPGAENVVATS